MATQFTATVKPSGGDYTSLNGAVTGLANDLTLATIKVFSISASTTPTIAAGDTVLGQTSGATGVCVLVNAARTQILIKTIAVASFLNTEVVQKASNSNVKVTLSNTGDIPIIGIECYSMLDTTEVSTVNYITSENNYLRIYTPLSERHAGKWDDTKYRLVTTWGGIYISTDYVRIEGIQLQIIRDGDGGSGIYVESVNPNNDIRISNSIIKALISGGTYHSGIGVFNYNTAKIWNNIIYGFIFAGLDPYNCAISCRASSVIYAYNNTVYNNDAGFVSDTTTAILKNNLSYNNTYNHSGSFDEINSTNNLSGNNQLDAPGLNPRNLGAGEIVSFVDEINKDFHLASNDVSARNRGVDLSGDPNLAFNNDVDGQTRPSTVWDIGADQVSTCPIIGIQFTVI